MIKRFVDWTVSVVSPSRAAVRAKARRIERHYKGAEQNRLTSQHRPKNQSANTEMQGPWGADTLRATARHLVRDNAYAWSALESIVSEVVGSGFGVQSMLDDDENADPNKEDTNEKRNKTWDRWAEVCDINGELTFDEIQTLAFREMVEAGECLLRYITVPRKYKGIERPVPLAIELIEADRLASDYDTYAINRGGGKRITRGIEMDENGRPIAYWIYPAHPTEPNTFQKTPERIPASEIEHLYRKDRIGQSRGVTWYAPAIAWLRDLGLYVDHEIQASAVASCFTAVIKSADGTVEGIPSTDNEDTTDASGAQYEFLQPGMIMNLGLEDEFDSANPSRPNANAGPWIGLMLQGIAAGTGTSYEAISKDFSNTSYSSARTSKLENRPRYRRWQRYWKAHCCQPTWDRFCDAAAMAGREEFPTATELLSDRRAAAPVEFMPPVWEWVDVEAEQASSEAAIRAYQTTRTDDLGSRGKTFRATMRKVAAERKVMKDLGLLDNEEESLSIEESLQKMYLSTNGPMLDQKEARDILAKLHGLNLSDKTPEPEEVASAPA